MTTYQDKINEIKAHAIERLTEIAEYKNIAREDVYDLHNVIFNEDYYIVGYYKAQQWIGADAFRMIGDIQEAEELHHGEKNTTLDNAETVANHWAYWIGLDIIQEAYDQVLDSLDN